MRKRQWHIWELKNSKKKKRKDEKNQYLNLSAQFIDFSNLHINEHLSDVQLGEIYLKKVSQLYFLEEMQQNFCSKLLSDSWRWKFI